MPEPEFKPEEQHEATEEQVVQLATQLKPRFISAARKARQLQQNTVSAKDRAGGSWQRFWALAAVSLILLLVVGWLTWPLLNPHRAETAKNLAQVSRDLVIPPAIAEEYPGFVAVVISAFDRHVVGGVEAHELVTAADGSVAESLRAVSTSAGLLEIPPDNKGRERDYVLKYREQEVGRIKTGPEDGQAHGTHFVQVDVPAESVSNEYAVKLEPGEHQELESGLTIGLANQAAGSWSGTVVHNRAWPSVFNYGNVLAGIYRVEGPAVELELGVYVNRDKLALTAAGPEQLRLTAQSDRYLESVKADPDPDLRSIAACHRGWYDCAAPPRDYLPRLELGLAEDENGAWVSWAPVAGTAYAIRLPPQGDWQAGVVQLQLEGQAAIDTSDPSFTLLSQRGAGNSLYFYDVEFSFPQLGISGHVPGYPQGNWPLIPLSATQVSRGYKRHPELAELLQQSPVPAEFYLRRFDFTTQNPERCGPLQVILGADVGSYSIEFGSAQPGEMVSMRLAGDLDRIVGRPAWDLDRDGDPDAWGMDTELLVSKFGSYDIYVVLEEESGQRVMVNGLLEIPGKGIVGYTPKSLYGVNPVMAGTAACPAEETSFWVMSHYAMGSRATNSEHVSGYLGPRSYFDPPPEFDGQSLREIRLVLYASPRGGDSDEIFIAPLTYPVKLPIADGELSYYPDPLRVTAVKGRESIPYSGLLLDIGYLTMVGLEKYQKTGDPQAVLDFWTNYLPDDWDNFTHEYYLGFRRDAIPGAQELVDRLLEFRASPYYPVRFVTEEHQELIFRVNGYGLVIEPDLGFVIGGHLEDQNIYLGAQYEVYSGGDSPARVELETMDGDVYTRYLDYSVLE